MDMIVCVKQVPDPEAPPESFQVNTAANKMSIASSVNPVISPFDEQAVEAALRIKDKIGGKITVLSLGKDALPHVIKKPLAMGTDQLILIQDDAFEGGDSWATAFALSAAIRKIGKYDLIFCGRQAADWDAGQVGSGIAELLGIPTVTLARKIEIADGKATVERVILDGYEVVEAALPVLITVSNELGEPRYPTLKGIMATKKVEPTVWKAADLGVQPSQVGDAARRTKLVKLFKPVKEGKCQLIEADSPAEAGAKLALKLREAKLI